MLLQTLDPSKLPLRSSLIWVYTISLGLAVVIFRVTTVLARKTYTQKKNNSQKNKKLADKSTCNILSEYLNGEGIGTEANLPTWNQ